MVVRVGQKRARYRQTFFKEWRELRGLTQDQLADRLDATKSAVSKLETGKTRYNQSNLEAWADALNCEPADLLRHPDQRDNKTVLEQALQEVQTAVSRVSGIRSN